MAIFNESTCIDWQINYTCINEAKFSLLPKFKQDPELAKYIKDVEEAEKILNDNNIDITPEKLYKFYHIYMRICDIIFNIENVIALPLLINLIGIATHLMFRIGSYCIELNEEQMFYMRSRGIAEKLKKVINNEKDPRKKKELQKMYDKIIDNQNKLKDNNFSVRIIDKSYNYNKNKNK